MGVLRTPGRDKPSNFATAPKLPFEVLPEDIDGAIHSSYECPIARAIKRLYHASVMVGWGYAAIYWQEGKATNYTVSDGGAAQRYDKYDKIAPFTGELVKDG